MQHGAFTLRPFLAGAGPCISPRGRQRPIGKSVCAALQAWWVMMWYLAAREAPDRDDHSGVVGLLSVCDKIWRLEYSCTVSDEVRIWSVVLLEARDVKESRGRANH
jgi:hypothetical protein